MGHMDCDQEPVEVQLGFLETPENEIFLTPEYFPSKAGGKPAWLNPEDLPLTSQLECPNCKSPMTFLLQLYSPIETRDDCFHRTIYVFFCNETNCSGPTSRRFKVMRCQMPRQNDYYSYDPPPEDPAPDAKPVAPTYGPLCAVCGCRAPNRCSGCKRAAYCSRAHQIHHWREMGHKAQCKSQPGAADGEVEVVQRRSAALLPEMEIIHEAEEMPAEGDDMQDVDGDDDDRLKDYEDAVRALNAQRAKEGIAPIDKEDIPFDDAKAEKDAEFLLFQKRIKHNPEQIVRYIREIPDNALWVSSDNIPGPNSIPACQNCGSPRGLEFQILPQILYFLKIDHDWGLLSVYTCTKSCNLINRGGEAFTTTTLSSAYCDEFVWQQAISDKAAYKLPAAT